jgi:hypothetical protein
MDKETQSVRIGKDVLREIRINIATYGGTIRKILERGAEYAMIENKAKRHNKKK